MSKPKKPSVFGLLKNYRPMVLGLVVLSLISNALGLIIPQFIQQGIDAYTHGTLSFNKIIWPFLAIVIVVFILTALQSVLQTLASEKVAKDLREQLASQISYQNYPTLQALDPSKLLTYLTSDVDAIKTFVSQAIVSLASSLLLVVGASTLLLWTHWPLALAVLCVLPLIAFAFAFVFSRVRSLFKLSQGVTDTLNRMINESILGSALVRVLNTGPVEMNKFQEPNWQARKLGLRIIQLFAGLVPTITLVSGLGSLIIITLGGYFVINGHMTLGELTAFNIYMGLLIFPILVMGFTSNLIARASASYQRIRTVLDLKGSKALPSTGHKLQGGLTLKDINVTFDDKPVLKDINLEIQPGTRLAILGPTGAGKSLLLQVATGLLPPDNGTIIYDDKEITELSKQDLYPQMGIVFQESVLFNLTLRENIAFHESVTEEQLQKAIKTAALDTFIDKLPQKLDTIVSERGLSLSGGQKQRIMLARALALAPQILFLDDFTARVDIATERFIVEQLQQNYPELTLVSITQKVDSVKNYDQIIFMAEGQILYQGSHLELLKKSPEYAQLAHSQRSTESYESHV